MAPGRRVRVVEENVFHGTCGARFSGVFTGLTGQSTGLEGHPSLLLTCIYLNVSTCSWRAKTVDSVENLSSRPRAGAEKS